PFDSQHQYRVQLSTGTGTPLNLTFGAGDCGCSDNSGGVTVTIASCVGDADCDDGNPCTFDFCGNATCTHYFSYGIACTDGDPCTANDACLFGECVGVQACFDEGMLLRPFHPVLAGGSFGSQLAEVAGRLAIGAGSETTPSAVEGAVYVYDR